MHALQGPAGLLRALHMLCTQPWITPAQLQGQHGKLTCTRHTQLSLCFIWSTTASSPVVQRHQSTTSNACFFLDHEQWLLLFCTHHVTA